MYLQQILLEGLTLTMIGLVCPTLLLCLGDKNDTGMVPVTSHHTEQLQKILLPYHTIPYHTIAYLFPYLVLLAVYQN